mmetsp:Transcript_63560/g.151568  ORF Transcript_63560/g.151568 Transcript_63560/m.151568 type:complete len:247 (-) Transcript_63560:109-849(-)
MHPGSVQRDFASVFRAVRADSDREERRVPILPDAEFGRRIAFFQELLLPALGRELLGREIFLPLLLAWVPFLFLPSIQRPQNLLARDLFEDRHPLLGVLLGGRREDQRSSERLSSVVPQLYPPGEHIWRGVDPATEREASVDVVDVPAVEEGRRIQGFFELGAECVGYCRVRVHHEQPPLHNQVPLGPVIARRPRAAVLEREDRGRERSALQGLGPLARFLLLDGLQPHELRGQLDLDAQARHPRR